MSCNQNCNQGRDCTCGERRGLTGLELLLLALLALLLLLPMAFGAGMYLFLNNPGATVDCHGCERAKVVDARGWAPKVIFTCNK